MRVRSITGLEVPPTARPGDTFTFTGTLELTVTAVRAELIDTTPPGGPHQVLPGEVYAEIIGWWTQALLPEEETV